ncbi:hypothetical protein PTKIN_Ptkin10aG0197200 [Pterospermum kingtungense]
MGPGQLPFEPCPRAGPDALKPGTRPDVSGPLAQAFFTWGLASNFTFSKVQDFNSADLQISFERVIMEMGVLLMALMEPWLMLYH